MSAPSAATISWRAPDVDAARDEAAASSLLVLVDFFSPT